MKISDVDPDLRYEDGARKGDKRVELDKRLERLFCDDRIFHEFSR